MALAALTRHDGKLAVTPAQLKRSAPDTRQVERGWISHGSVRQTRRIVTPVQHGAMTSDRQASTIDSPAEGAIDYVRNVYDLAIGWFKIAEAKAQLILTANGIFMSLLFGTTLGKITEVQSLVKLFGPETWILLFTAVAALIGATSSAARSLWSRHRRRVVEDFQRLRMDPAVPDSYRPEGLWYFAELAHLPVETAAERLRQCGSDAEVVALSYNAVMLSRNVLRKHRLLNAGWACTAISLIAFVLAGTDVLVRASQ